MGRKKDPIKIIKEGMERELRDLRRSRIPEPTYFHKVGDRVTYGRWDWTGILEIIDYGKIYKCFSVTWKTKRNIPDSSEFQIHYLEWYRALPYQTEFPDRLEEDEDVFFNFSQRHISALLYKMFDENGVDLDVDYQRGNVWTIDQKIALIDSIFKNIDIGKFVIIKRPWGPDPNKPSTPLLYEMLDGKQRTTALYEYYIGKYPYKGLYYHQLHPRDRGHFREYPISYAESKPLTNEQKYRYFLKLNTSGTPVDERHLNKVRQMWIKEQEKKKK